jgi:hypothetical protein
VYESGQPRVTHHQSNFSTFETASSLRLKKRQTRRQQGAEEEDTYRCHGVLRRRIRTDKKRQTRRQQGADQ